MRILTVRQPWAWAIVHGQKDVENRVRNLAGAYRGPVAIHAGQAVDLEALTTPNIVGAVALKRIFTAAGHPSTFKESPRGAIIGVVDLTDVHLSGMECSRAPGCHEYELCSPWSEAYRHHLVLANPRPLSEPIPFKGALGLRTLPDDIVSLINERTTS